MSRPRLILCNGAQLPKNDPLRDGRYCVEFNTQGKRPNVNLQVDDVAQKFSEHLTPRLQDLLEVATYVYVADCATKRSGGKWTADDSLEPWERDHKFVIGVRDLAFWNGPEIKDLLIDTLQHLSDDTYAFEFCEYKQRKGNQQPYLNFGTDPDWPFYNAERVIMFSGGLDSLAGVVETATQGTNLVLVSHRPVSIQSSRQAALYDRIKKAFPPVKIIHVPVWINKTETISKEFTQRTRSFLYSALGAIVATSVNASGVRFFENGVVSLNFPVAGEVIGARASRTTHPKTLFDFERLYSLVLGRKFVVDNPFIYRTKKEVLETIVRHRQTDLIPYSCSCAHQGPFSSKTKWHCGWCSQCIDRRFAIVAAGLQDHEDSFDYKIDVFTGERKEAYQQNMAIGYVRHATELAKMKAEDIATRFNREISAAFPYCPDRSKAPQLLIDLHQRHAMAIQFVLADQLKSHVNGIIDGTVPAKSLLAFITSRAHLIESWRRYADRIKEVFRRGIPPICRNELPADEPRLQQICEGILKAGSVELDREYPFMKWGCNLTKPDWSREELGLWVEAKYVRKKSGLGKISEAIAADITKYGDSGRRVLFFVYDPEGVITDEDAFRKPILARDTMDVFILR